jgi:aryl-alcohol dehydrogenase-like predicted oxidoreductase
MDAAPRRLLGRTGLTVSPVGFGAFKIGRNEGIKYAQGYELPDEESCARLLHAVLDLGIDLIDTAPAYGISEARIGRHLRDRRDEFTLSTKAGETFENGEGRYDFSRASIDASVDRSLQRLRTDRLDLVFVHSDGRDREIIESGEALDVLAVRRDRGDLRAIGFSGKTVEGHLAAIATGLVDCLMVEYHELDDSQHAVLEAAGDAGVGVVVKKGLASGRLDPARAIPFCLRGPGVASVIIGSLNADNLARNLQIARDAIQPGVG